MDLSAVSDADDEDDEAFVFDAVDDPPVSDAESPERPRERLHAGRSRILREREDPPVDPAPDLGVQPRHLALRGRETLEAAGYGRPSRRRASS